METKRKICEGEMEKKQIFLEDRLSRLPEELQVRILSCLHDTKDVVQTSMLLKKRWVSLWTWIPVLDFDCFDAYNNFDVFNKFVDRVLCLRDQSAKLDRLTLTRLGARSYKILEEAFDYAFSHGVKHLEADIIGGIGPWPVPVCVDASLTSLKLGSGFLMSCPFLGPTSRSFKNLTALYLKSVFISDLDPFSGFPVLETLTLVRCFIDTDGQTTSVHARNLLDLTIEHNHDFKCCKLQTPRLQSFHYEGCELPLFRAHKGLPALDNIVIGFKIESCSHTRDKRKLFDNLLTLFCTIDNVKSLTLFWSTVELMSSFPEELVNRNLTFRNLKCLKLDFRNESKGSSISTKIVADVKLYLLHNSPDVQVITINHTNLVSCDV